MIDHFNGETTYVYNDRNLVTKVIDRNSRETEYQYNSGGLLTRIDYPNGTYTVYTYTARNWTDTITHRKSDQYNTLIASFDYDYAAASWGKNGTRTKVTEAILKPDNLTYIEAVVEYEYDDLYQLTSEVRSGVNAGVTYTKLYAYDAVGNRTSMTVDGGTPITYSYNSRNQMTVAGSAEYTYYPDGNMNTKTDGGVTSYIWSVDNKLIEVKEGQTTIAAYNYSGRGLRCEMAEGGTTTRFYYDGGRVIEEAVGGSMTAFYGSPEVYVDSAWETQHTDGIQSVRVITSTSETVQKAYLYDSFGNVSAHYGSTVSPFTYAGGYGYYSSGASRLYLLMVRYYDSAVGRFISADPLRYKDGLNLYAYVRNNPIMRVDPTGTVCRDVSADKNITDCLRRLRRCMRRDPILSTINRARQGGFRFQICDDSADLGEDVNGDYTWRPWPFRPRIRLREGFGCASLLHELSHARDGWWGWTPGSENRAADYGVNRYYDNGCDNDNC